VQRLADFEAGPDQHRDDEEDREDTVRSLEHRSGRGEHDRESRNELGDGPRAWKAPE
jgi:hypothetical protein